MRLYFYRGLSPNFGDELNQWLLPKVFPGLFDDDASTLFLGIGSVLFDHHPEHCRKVVFGSGYGGYTALPRFDENWHFSCVRGPRTADACGIGRDKVAGDPAILIRRFRERTPQSSGRNAFMPHWESAERGNWQGACRLAGLHLIDPRWPVDEVLNAIEGSDTLITEAMHGAIVADALRVPWIPVLPLHASHRLKWFDWAESLDLKLSPYVLWPSSTSEMVMACEQILGRDQRHRSFPIRLWRRSARVALGNRCAESVFAALAAQRLRRLSRLEPFLSSDAALERVLGRLETRAERIKLDWSGRAIEQPEYSQKNGKTVRVPTGMVMVANEPR
jgi:hypothetical protein